MRKINQIIIHCSATGPHMEHVDAAWINRVHLKAGMVPTANSPATGYHYVIKRDGMIETGRPESRVGAHARGHNANSIGVCLVGGVATDNKTPEDNFTPEQHESLEVMLKFLYKRFGKVETLGHRDLPNVAKACPSFDVRSWLESNNI